MLYTALDFTVTKCGTIMGGQPASSTLIAISVSHFVLCKIFDSSIPRSPVITFIVVWVGIFDF